MIQVREVDGKLAIVEVGRPADCAPAREFRLWCVDKHQDAVEFIAWAEQLDISTRALKALVRSLHEVHCFDAQEIIARATLHARSVNESELALEIGKIEENHVWVIGQRPDGWYSERKPRDTVKETERIVHCKMTAESEIEDITNPIGWYVMPGSMRYSRRTSWFYGPPSGDEVFYTCKVAATAAAGLEAP